MAVDEEGRPVPDEAPSDAPRALPYRAPVVEDAPVLPAAGPEAVGAPPDAPRALARTIAAPADDVDATPRLILLASTDDGGPAGAPLVGPEDVRVLGGLGPLPAIVEAALTAHLAGLVSSLELRLNRALAVRRQTDLCVPDTDGRIHLSASPLLEVESIVQGGQPVVWSSSNPSPTAYFWRPGLVVEVTYTAGLPSGSPLEGTLRAAVAAKALPYARALLAQADADDSAAGAAPAAGGWSVPAPPPGVKAFAVEGLNVTFESTSEAVAAAAKTALDVAALAVWSDADLAPLGRARRIVAL